MSMKLTPKLQVSYDGNKYSHTVVCNTCGLTGSSHPDRPTAISLALAKGFKKSRYINRILCHACFPTHESVQRSLRKDTKARVDSKIRARRTARAQAAKPRKWERGQSVVINLGGQ